MLIVWGRKRKERTVGFAADFCPVCRQIQPVRVTRVGMVGHVYYISFGEGTLVGYQAKCNVCSLVFGTNPIKYQQTVLKAPTDIKELIQTTFPKIHEVYAERLSLEEQLRLHPNALSVEQREALVLEPLQFLSPLVEAKLTGRGEFDRRSGLGCIGTMVVGFALFLIGAMCFKGPAQDRFLMFTVAVVGLGIFRHAFRAPRLLRMWSGWSCPWL